MVITKKPATANFWSRTILPYIVFLILLIVTSCAPPGLDTSDQSDQKNNGPQPTPIVASYTVPRILQYCADTFPLVSNTLFKSGAALVADMLDSPGTVNLNEGKIEVFISYIVGSNSYLMDAFAWLLDAIPNDPQAPMLTPTPSAATVKGSSYDVANAQSTAQASNGAILSSWYSKLNANHALLSAARATMAKYTSRLRSFPNINSPSPEEVGGCLLSASTRMAGFPGRKTIILSSPLAEDASTLPFIDLTGISVEVINWNCVLSSAQACIASRNAWEAKLLSFHVSSVSIRDVQDSQVVKPSF